jgi:hypothetical protein
MARIEPTSFGRDTFHAMSGLVFDDGRKRGMIDAWHGFSGLVMERIALRITGWPAIA